MWRGLLRPKKLRAWEPLGPWQLRPRPRVSGEEQARAPWLSLLGGYFAQGALTSWLPAPPTAQRAQDCPPPSPLPPRGDRGSLPQPTGLFPWPGPPSHRELHDPPGTALRPPLPPSASWWVRAGSPRAASLSPVIVASLLLFKLHPNWKEQRLTFLTILVSRQFNNSASGSEAWTHLFLEK
ncbi:hypothetical protein HJG60_009989 [Phyllostomus discolor]|uniref:Uncharacterized protein n=1 Tax=Phyllostomus discolor TaxID=89673 RepID=A0A834EQ78_9CHIR|nr:hypothetical protein HJG60_009989 [Phyllostomus discolor]